MKRALAAALLVCTAWPAQATGEISCGGEGVGVDLLVGSLDVLSIARAVITIRDRTWSSTPDSWPGQPIAVGQAFEDDRARDALLLAAGWRVLRVTFRRLKHHPTLVAAQLAAVLAQAAAPRAS